MANRRISVARFPATPSEPAVNINIIDNGDGTVTLFVDDGLAQYSAPITAAGAKVVGSAAGTVSGSGTTNKLPKWTNGPGRVLGDSIATESAGPVAITIAGNLNVNNSNLAATVIRSTDIRGFALTGSSFWDSSAPLTPQSSGVGVNGQVLLISVPGAFRLQQATGVFASYIGITNVAGSQVDSVIGFELHNWVKSAETILECIGLYIDDSLDGFAPGNTFAIKCESTEPSLLSGPLDVNTTGAIRLGDIAAAGNGTLITVDDNGALISIRAAEDVFIETVSTSIALHEATQRITLSATDISLSGNVLLPQLGLSEATFLDANRALVSTPLADGQLLIGATGADPASGSLASGDGSIAITPGPNTIDLAVTNPFTPGASGSFTAQTGEVVTVVNGIITSIV